MAPSQIILHFEGAGGLDLVSSTTVALDICKLAIWNSSNMNLAFYTKAKPYNNSCFSLLNLILTKPETPRNHYHDL